MTQYPGVYRSRCVGVEGDTITAYIPQVFGDLRVPITHRTGAKPQRNAKGWVMFESADPSYPVWMSSVGGTSAPAPASTVVAGEPLSYALFSGHDPIVTIPDDTYTEVPLTVAAPLSLGSSDSRLVPEPSTTGIYRLFINGRLSLSSAAAGSTLLLEVTPLDTGDSPVEGKAGQGYGVVALPESSDPYTHYFSFTADLFGGAAEYAITIRQKTGQDITIDDDLDGDMIFFTGAVTFLPLG